MSGQSLTTCQYLEHNITWIYYTSVVNCEYTCGRLLSVVCCQMSEEMINKTGRTSARINIVAMQIDRTTVPWIDSECRRPWRCHATSACNTDCQTPCLFMTYPAAYTRRPMLQRVNSLLAYFWFSWVQRLEQPLAHLDPNTTVCRRAVREPAKFKRQDHPAQNQQNGDAEV